METDVVVAQADRPLLLLSAMANRHGLIAGATGTGKTVTLRVIAEGLSKIGVPCFMADVKGDLGGIAKAGEASPKISERATALGITSPEFRGFPVAFWDVFGERGHPVRATVTELGPLLLSRLLNLNDTQTSVLQIIFKLADDHGLLLLDLKDLHALIRHLSENAREYTAEYGNISTASLGAIQRNLLALSEQGGDIFFGEPALNLDDLIQTDSQGLGVINILSAEKLLQSPTIYSTFLLWLLSELFERLPEAGDLDKPKLVFFFDEAHLLFDEAPRPLLDKIEQLVRLIRSKGVGVYFITQAPTDVPDDVLGQLGNRVQHALRAFSAKDQKAVRASAQTFRTKEGLDVEKVITELGVGEALVSFLDAKGMPTPVERSLIYPPRSNLSPLPDPERKQIIQKSVLYGHYEERVDQESAFEVLKARTQKQAAETPASLPQQVQKTSAARGRQTPLEAFINSTARAVGSQVGRQLFRGLLGSLMKR